VEQAAEAVDEAVPSSHVPLFPTSAPAPALAA
jgi:hypothetical protein